MRRPSFPLYLYDWLSSTTTTLMGAEGRGIFIDLLCRDYADDGLPDNDEELAALGRTDIETWKKHSAIIRKKFEKCEDGRLRNPKIAGIKKEQTEYSEKQSQNAYKRWKKDNNADAMPPQCDGNACGDAKPIPSFSSSLSSSSSHSSSGSTPPKKIKPSRKTFMFGKEHSERGELLRTLILRNNPQAKITEKDVERWANEVRLMMEIDGRTLGQIDAVLQWTQDDDFERANVLSMSKLRKRFDQLWLKMQRPQSAEDRRRAMTLEAGRRFIERGESDGE